MSYAEGFKDGLSAVSDAIQNKRQNDIWNGYLTNANQEHEQAIQDHERQIADDEAARKLEQQRYDQKIASDTAAAQQEQANKDREYGLKDAQFKLDNQKALQTQQKNAAGLAQMQAETAQTNFKTQYMKKQAEQQAAQMRAQTLFSKDPNTGMITLNLTPGYENSQLDDLEKGYGVNVRKVAGDLSKFNNDIANIKTSLVNPQYFQQNKKAVLQSFNDLEGQDINTGLGKYEGTNPKLQGGEVTHKEISNIYPAPNSDGYVFEVTSTIRKGGKDYHDKGPMTLYRSSNPADNMVRVVPTAAIVQRINGYDAMGKVLEANPQFTRAIQNLKGNGKPDKYIKVSVPQEGPGGLPLGKKDLLYNQNKGTVLDPEKVLQQQNLQQDAQPWLQNAPGPNAPTNMTPKQKGPGLDQALRNVGAL